MFKNLFTTAIVCLLASVTAYGQDEIAETEAQPLCCGQTVAFREASGPSGRAPNGRRTRRGAFEATPQILERPASGRTTFLKVRPSREQTQLQIERMLNRRHTTRALRRGSHVLSRGPQGYRLMARVNRAGQVQSWFVVNRQGRRITMMKDNDNEVDVEGCLNIFVHWVEECDRIGGTEAEYQACMIWAWRNFLKCVRGGKGPGGSTVAQ